MSALKQDGQLSEKISALKQLARKDPRNAPTLIVEAELYLKAGMKEQAAELALDAFSLAPNNFRVQRGSSGILAASGHLDIAITAARAAVNLKPEVSSAKLHLGGLLLRAGHASEAVEELRAYIKTADARSAGWIQLATALLRVGLLEDAIKICREGVDREPESIENQLALVSILDASGRLGDSLEVLNQLIERIPDNARVFRARSGIYEALGDIGNARVDAEKAHQISPDNSLLREHFERLVFLEGMRNVVLQFPQRPNRTDIFVYPRKEVHFLFRYFQIVRALLLHEMLSRFGRSQAGYLWAIVEPIGHLLTLGLVFSFFNKSPPPVGPNLFLYYITGLLPFLWFSHISHELMHTRNAAGSLLQLPIINNLALLSARAALLCATELAVMVIIFSVSFWLIGYGWPVSFLDAVLALLTLTVFAFGCGTINMCLTEFLSWWDTFFASIVRLLYFASGIYYSPIAMPSVVRDLLVWNPVLQAIEWFRVGFYGRYDPHWLSEGYLLKCSLLTLTAGLLLERAIRPRMRVPL